LKNQTSDDLTNYNINHTTTTLTGKSISYNMAADIGKSEKRRMRFPEIKNAQFSCRPPLPLHELTQGAPPPGSKEPVFSFNRRWLDYPPTALGAISAPQYSTVRRFFSCNIIS
jgi:hypothetical protein